MEEDTLLSQETLSASYLGRAVSYKLLWGTEQPTPLPQQGSKDFP